MIILNKRSGGLLIEHEFSRRIAIQIKKHLKRWKEGEDAREPVARFLKTYSIYLMDHMTKEENFFEKPNLKYYQKKKNMICMSNLSQL